MGIREDWNDKILIFDGGMGSLLQGAGLKPGELPETWNLKHPEVPCLIRRAAMHKAFGDDGTVYTEPSIYEMQNKNAEGMGIQLRSFQYAIDKIKQALDCVRV